MPTLKVNVKWGRQLFQDIEIDTDAEPILFKEQLYTLTGVEPRRQKLLFKGNTLKDTEWNVDLKEGSTVFLLGSIEEVPEIPATPTTFTEDLSDSELSNDDLLFEKEPCGLTNLGNTCYLNATLQCLRSIPELCEALHQFVPQIFHTDAASNALTSSIKLLFRKMEKSKSMAPSVTLQVFHKISPQFSQKGANGLYCQQDANECWLELLKLLRQLPATKCSEADAQMKQYESFVQQHLSGTFTVTMRCAENPEEAVVSSTEQFIQLSCFISTDVRDMKSGLVSEMKEHLTKYSESLGRDAVFDRTSQISRLPAYLTVQFMRFQYKGKAKINAKILKDIKFPLEFDAYDLCTPELQEKLKPYRDKLKEVEDVENRDTEAKSVIENQCIYNDEPKMQSYWFKDDIGSNNTGYYRLISVLTHKGRSTSSGHYVAWIRENADSWYKLDDDVVSSVTTSEILRLSGGGDWHCAYVLLYGPKV